MILFLAAFAPELAALDRALQREVVGVGLVEAAIGTTQVLARRGPSGVILVGTAGAFPSAGLSIGDVVVAERILLAAPSGALVAGMAASLTADASLTPHIPGRRVTVATTLSITTDDAVAHALAEATGAHVEHLEAFAVARACVVAGVPFTAVFGVANIVGTSGRDQWREHHEVAAAAACVQAYACR